MEERIVTPHQLPEDEAAVGAPVNLRPTALSEFVGQKQVCENLKIFIEAAKMRREALDHVLLFGPPGWAKRRWHRSLPRNWTSILKQLRHR